MENACVILIYLDSFFFMHSCFQKDYDHQVLRTSAHFNLFLWGLVKNTVYLNHPHICEELQVNIHRAVDGMSSKTLNVMFQ